MNRQFRIMIISEGYGRAFFGVSQVLIKLADFCRKNSFKFKVLVALKKDVPSIDVDSVHEIPVNQSSKSLMWHENQSSFFYHQMARFFPEVIHVHGVFTFVQRNAVKVATQLKIPVVISPHGMLEPWLWKQKGILSYLLKRLYWLVVLRPVLKQVDFVHAITYQESETLGREFPGVPQIKISNAIDLSEYSSMQVAPDSDRYLLFIGRLHPKKGVDLLIEAFKKSVVGNVRLVIAGPDFDVDYTARLKALVENLGLSERTSFVRSVHGEQKSELLQKAWCTVIPSYSDVVALINLESAASFTPTITTTMTGLSDWQEGGGLLVEPELEPLTNAIVTACNWSQDKRMLMGKRARSFVEERYSWDVIGEQWVEAYKMIAESREGAHE